MQNTCDSSCRQPCNIAHARIALEMRCIRLALRELKKDGWIVTAVHNGEEKHDVITVKQMLEVITSVDESTVWVSNLNKKSWFHVVLGNGIDLIPDYGMNIDGPMDRAYDQFERLEN